MSFNYVNLDQVLAESGLRMGPEGVESRSIDDEGYELWELVGTAGLEWSERELLAPYYAAAYYNEGLRKIQNWLISDQQPMNLSPRIPREQMPSWENLLASRTWEWRILGGTPVPYKPLTTDNDAAFVYLSTYFTPINPSGDFLSRYGVAIVSAAIGGIAMLGAGAATTAGTAAGELAVEGAVAETAGEFAFEGAVAETAGELAFEGAVAETAGGFAFEGAVAETAGELAFEGAVADLAIEEAAAEFTFEEIATEFGIEEIATSPALEPASFPPDAMPSPPPETGSGFTLQNAAKLAQQALPLALKAFTKPGGAPVASPYTIRSTQRSPQSLYLQAPLTDDLTMSADNRMLWVGGAVIFAATLFFATRSKRPHREGKSS